MTTPCLYTTCGEQKYPGSQAPWHRPGHGVDRLDYRWGARAMAVWIEQRVCCLPSYASYSHCRRWEEHTQVPHPAEEGPGVFSVLSGTMTGMRRQKQHFEHARSSIKSPRLPSTIIFNAKPSTRGSHKKTVAQTTPFQASNQAPASSSTSSNTSSTSSHEAPPRDRPPPPRPRGHHAA